MGQSVQGTLGGARTGRGRARRRRLLASLLIALLALGWAPSMGASWRVRMNQRPKQLLGRRSSSVRALVGLNGAAWAYRRVCHQPGAEPANSSRVAQHRNNLEQPI